MIIERHILLASNNNKPQLAKLLPLIKEKKGLLKIVFKEEANSLVITYDQLLLNYSELTEYIENSGFSCKTGWYSKLRLEWISYLDIAARDNASASPPTCCNKTPKIKR